MPRPANKVPPVVTLATSNALPDASMSSPRLHHVVHQHANNHLATGMLRLVIQHFSDQISAGGGLLNEDFAAISDLAHELHHLTHMSKAAEEHAKKAAEASQDHSAQKTDFPDDLSDLQPWQQELIRVFYAVDNDGSGSIGAHELRRALNVCHIPRARLTKLLKLADADNSGDIDLAEWIRVVRDTDTKEMQILSVELAKNKSETGDMFTRRVRTYPCMLSPLSWKRFAWDFCIMLLCYYIGIFQPFYWAFEASFQESTLIALDRIDIFIDCVFLVDIFLNFRTGYVDKNAEPNSDPVMEWQLVATYYVRTWLLLDVLSILPFGLITSGTFMDLQFGKLVKLSKLSKVGKMSKFFQAELLNRCIWLEELTQKQGLRFLYRRGGIFVVMALLCHWMACVVKIVDSRAGGAGILSSYQDVKGSVDSEYLAALYWSMTTITTVGYGDMTPTSDAERVFTMFAMVIGGGFYGYFIGSISSVVAQQDLNASAYYERMDLVYAWVEHHRIPRNLKRTVCRYFRFLLAEKSAVNEAEFWGDLSPDLQKAVGEYIVHADVKYNPLFDGITLSAIVLLQSILHKFTGFAGQVLTKSGDAGTAMYIIDSGTVLIEYDSHEEQSQILEPGQSFGEEVLLGLMEHYDYTTTAQSQVRLEMIYEDAFRQLFQSMPHVLERMRHNALQLNPQWAGEDD